MSVRETDSAQAAERAMTDPTAAAEKADRWNDPRLPWNGKPRAADILCWLGIVVSGSSYWVLLPLRLSLVGTHPVLAELLNCGPQSIFSAAALPRAGGGTLGLARPAPHSGPVEIAP